MSVLSVRRVFSSEFRNRANSPFFGVGCSAAGSGWFEAASSTGGPLAVSGFVPSSSFDFFLRQNAIDYISLSRVEWKSVAKILVFRYRPCPESPSTQPSKVRRATAVMWSANSPPNEFPEIHDRAEILEHVDGNR